ncbi:hypothetical protein EUGRSUZ_L02147, partial [Eucalyptus grandis]
CDLAYAHCLSLTQHAFDSIFPYQLSSAAAHLHRSLSPPSLLVSRLTAPSVSPACHRPLPTFGGGDGPQLLGAAEFREWAVELFASAVVESAGRVVLTRVLIGVAGITGVGIAMGSEKEVIGSVIGVYELGVATSIYLGLSG